MRIQVSCRGLDPIGDTESLSEEGPDTIARWSCRGLDPIGDTESKGGGFRRNLPQGCRGLDPIGDTESQGGGGISA